MSHETESNDHARLYVKLNFAPRMLFWAFWFLCNAKYILQYLKLYAV